jgi:antitoxin MazE
MTTKVSKWGNSLALRLPKSMIKELNLQDGSEVSIIEENGKIVILPTKKDLTIQELIQGMTVDGVMDQYKKNESIGKEKFWEDNE